MFSLAGESGTIEDENIDTLCYCHMFIYVIISAALQTKKMTNLVFIKAMNTSNEYKILLAKTHYYQWQNFVGSDLGKVTLKSLNQQNHV